MAREVYFPELYSPPVPFEEKKALLEKSALGRLYLDYQPYSIDEVTEKLFEHDAVRGMISFLSVIRGFETDSRNMGMIAVSAIASGVNTQMSRGSTHKLAHTLNKMLVKSGAEVIEGPVQRDGGRSLGSMRGTSLYTRDPDNNLLEFMVY